MLRLMENSKVSLRIVGDCLSVGRKTIMRESELRTPLKPLCNIKNVMHCFLVDYFFGIIFQPI